MAKNWAICVGINRYDNLSPLNYAVRDAEAMRDYFTEVGFDQVYLFTDNSPAITDAGKPFNSQPSFGSLRRFLRVRFDKAFLSSGDNFWFFFSGHGMRHGEKDYLLPCDGDPHPEGIEETAIPLSYVSERLRRCGADNVVLLLDACRNEGGSKGIGLGEEEQQGVITLASCSPSERSYEIEALQQGSFTYGLLEALRIQGAGNCATVERLEQRLRYRIPEINQAHRKPKQNPYAVVEPAFKYHLILLQNQATLQDVGALKLAAFEAQTEANFVLAEQLWTRILAVSPADAQALKALRQIWNQNVLIQQSSGPKDGLLFERSSMIQSKKDMNYIILCRSLKLQKWQSADYATQRILYKLADQEGKSQLAEEDIRNIPLDDLSNLDQLWINSSDSRFGFNVQRQIWLEEGGQIDSETLLRVSERVGWKQKGGLFLNYGDLYFNLNAPKGQFPVIWSSGSWIVAGLGSINSLILLDHYNQLFDS